MQMRFRICNILVSQSPAESSPGICIFMPVLYRNGPILGHSELAHPGW
jgi:hypothetical protein